MNEDIEIQEPDNEWHVRHNPDHRAPVAWKRPAVIILVILGLLLTGIIGGVAGFVTLANADAAWARQARKVLGIDELSELRVPVRQDIKLEESSAVIDATKKVSPAVVSVTGSTQVVDFFGQVSDRETSGGTGFIITSDGLIVTNRHVISAAGTYKVLLNDGREFPAEIKAVDSLNDLAVLKIEATDLPVVELGSSSDLQIGQYVIAVGNALGQFQNSVTLGVVSAKDRQLSNVGGEGEALGDLIQTDAAINPGNSGGPLVNLAGQVVGINTVIASNTGGSIGIGFAISIDSVKSVLDSVRRTGEIIRPYLGVRYSIINKTVQRRNNLPVDYGAILLSNGVEFAVLSGSPAEKAGLRERDILLEINNERIDENNPLPRRLAKYEVGQTVTVRYLRDGAEATVDIVLERQPEI